MNQSGSEPDHPNDPHGGGHDPHGGGHGRWMMIACCIPMLVIAVAHVATGIVGAGFIVAALLCTVMMAVMMKGMSHGGGG